MQTIFLREKRKNVTIPRSLQSHLKCMPCRVRGDDRNVYWIPFAALSKFIESHLIFHWLSQENIVYIHVRKFSAICRKKNHSKLCKQIEHLQKAHHMTINNLITNNSAVFSEASATSFLASLPPRSKTKREKKCQTIYVRALSYRCGIVKGEVCGIKRNQSLSKQRERSFR